MRRRDGFAAIAFLIWTAAAGAQTTVPTSNSNEIVAVRTAMPPVIDGVIGEDEWKGAAIATGFIQYEPRRGEPSGVRTEATVLFDAGHLYVAFRVWDGEPITAQLTQRDADLFTDDAVAVVLDTTLDKRSGYYFITNALGTQADGRIAEDGRTLDSNWDAPWQSAARRTDYGCSLSELAGVNVLSYSVGRFWVAPEVTSRNIAPPVTN